MTRPDPSLREQNTIRTLLRIGGPILLGIGLVLAIAGFVSFFSAFGNPSGGMPTNFWMAFIGLPMLAAGASLTRAGFLGPASRYVAGEVTPTIRDTMGALGIGAERIVCPSCGTENDATAKFCDGCGRPLNRACTACGAENDANARFCDGCGHPLPA